MVPVLPHRLLSDCPQGGRTIQNNPLIHSVPPFFASLLAKVICFIIILHLLSPFLLFPVQPGPELRLPPHPRGSARAPAADRPSAEHRGLRLRPQSAPHPPVVGLRHPEACPGHPPLRDLRQRALSHLQRLLTGESGSGRPCDSSWRVIDGAVTRWGGNTSALTCYRQAPAPLHAHLRGVSSYLCCLLFLGCHERREGACSKQQGAC